MIAPLRKTLDAVKGLLRQGTSPVEIARAVALAAVIGVFPILGSTTLLCAGAAAALRLNLPLMQLVNWVIYPLQLALLIPLMSLGTRFFGTGPLPTLSELMKLVASEPMRAIQLFWPAGLSAVGAWLVLAPIAAIAIYAAVLFPLRRFVPEPAR